MSAQNLRTEAQEQGARCMRANAWLLRSHAHRYPPEHLARRREWVASTCRSRTDQPSGAASPQLPLIQQLTDTGLAASRIEPRSVGKTYSLPCRSWRRAGQRGFPSVCHAKSLKDAREIVGAPAMTQYECSRDGPWVLTYPQVASRLPKQSLEAIVHVQLLEEDLHQRR